MRIPKIEGTIDRRILINYTVDKDVLTKFLPKQFRPVLIGDKGLAGICLIRLKHIRPLGFPEFMGMSSENAAHRIAVEWTETVKQNKAFTFRVAIPIHYSITGQAGGFFPEFITWQNLMCWKTPRIIK